MVNIRKEGLADNCDDGAGITTLLSDGGLGTASSVTLLMCWSAAAAPPDRPPACGHGKRCERRTPVVSTHPFHPLFGRRLSVEGEERQGQRTTTRKRRHIMKATSLWCPPGPC